MTVHVQCITCVSSPSGEHVTETELAESLMTLLGFSEDPEVEGAFAVDPSIGLQDLPERISAADFAEDLLGLSTD